MSLLSAADKLEIRDAIRSVTDTFAITPVTYYIGGDSIDRWQEGREDKYYFSIELDALQENEDEPVGESTEGSENLKEITVTFNLDYLQEKGLINAEFQAAFDPTKDYFKSKGKMYKVYEVKYDGPLSKKDVLVIVKGRLRNFSNIRFNSLPLPENFKP